MHKWNEITDENSLKEFMERVSFFHDSCIKEMHYLSGAYVNENLDMYPVNDRRILRVIISFSHWSRGFEHTIVVVQWKVGFVVLCTLRIQ